MFHEEFYPTPLSVIDRMIEPHLDAIKSGAVILDPSAGKGDILRHIGYQRGVQKKNLFAVEIVPDLQAILRSAEIRVIGDDWLKFSSAYHFDLILMNPPFSNGVDHLLKAWDVLRSGHIVCLLNAETIRNPNSQKRELLSLIIEQHGSVEFIGDVFKKAERTTGVDVALVRLEKQAAGVGFDFSNLKTGKGKEFDFSEDQLNSQVARADLIGALVTSYQEAEIAIADYVRAERKANFYGSSFFAYPTYGSKSSDDPRQFYNDRIDELKSAAWSTVFERTKFRTVLTNKVREDFQRWQKEQGATEFTRENIEAFFDTLFFNRHEIMNRCLLEVFESFTRYDAKNKVHWEGWKTNSAYKVNRKVIMPWFIELSPWSGFSVRYDQREKLRDIDRVMCMLTGKRFGSITDPQTGEQVDGILTIEDALIASFKDPMRDNTAESEFFELRYFKKGTLHMVFKDKQVWDEFNLRAAKGKNWIGASE